MSSIKFVNKNSEIGFSFTNHGGGRINLGPSEELTITLNETRGPYNKAFLEAFYEKYSAYLTTTVALDDVVSSGITEATADAKYAAKSSVYTKAEADAAFAPKV